MSMSRNIRETYLCNVWKIRQKSSKPWKQKLRQPLSSQIVYFQFETDTVINHLQFQNLLFSYHLFNFLKISYIIFPFLVVVWWCCFGRRCFFFSWADFLWMVDSRVYSKVGLREMRKSIHYIRDKTHISLITF